MFLFLCVLCDCALHVVLALYSASLVMSRVLVFVLEQELFDYLAENAPVSDRFISRSMSQLLSG